MQRSNASAILNDLYKGGILLKVKGKPVLYTNFSDDEICFILRK